MVEHEVYQLLVVKEEIDARIGTRLTARIQPTPRDPRDPSYSVHP